MSDDRLIEVEMKLAHQDQMLIELNAALTNQQQSIITLERLCASISERLSSLGEGEGDAPSSAQDERPPHY
jgi:SlyX protein